ncbi:TonB-dependent receptor [Sphingomonas yabuuchiae]|uniref:TonB-dependent receptor n=2 Tax=Sphingomonas yabuuchiae TaxID=172044 RepID=A0A147IZ92_9SPHN|nr:TonB-dependent receptor [Sphingomonas yabuuchiae]
MGLLTSVASIPAAAQEVSSPPTPSSSRPVPAGSATLGDRPEPAIDFRGADGGAMSPEIQRKVIEQLRKEPLPPAPTPPPRLTRPGVEQKAVTGPDGDVVVSGQRARGSVLGSFPPERSFSPLDIRALGVNNIGDLLDAIRPQVSSDRGREDGDPVVLLNGKRISSFLEIAKFPTEAIERMEIFPEELSLRYGFPADQKVVNVVTFERYAAGVGQIDHATSTDGGRDTSSADANYLRIRNDTRFNLNGEYNRASALLESQRDIVRDPNIVDDGRFRTLLPRTEQFALTGTVSGNVVKGVSSTLNGRVQASSTRSLFGLAGDRPLTRDTDASVLHLGTVSSGSAGQWSWTLTGNYDRATADTFTDPGRIAGTRDVARSVNSFTNADLLLSGSPLKLPAGPASLSVRGGVEFRDFNARSSLSGNDGRTKLSRDRTAVQASLDLPITRARPQRANGLGSLSVNANLEVEDLSDVGVLRTFGYGLNWSPLRGISFIASMTDEDGAPTVEQLGAPLVVTPNVRTLDFTRREAVDVTRVFGGNPALRPDNRHVTRLALNLQPLRATDFTVSINYIRTRTDDPIAVFPIATPDIEAALPDRFVRDSDGRLLRIDTRPLNFERSSQDQMRWGLNFTRPLGAVPPGLQNANVRVIGGGEVGLQGALPPGARVIRPEAGSAAARRVENLTSRLIFSIYHTWRFRDEIIVREGAPVLDLLNGSAIDNRGGRPRHEVQAQAGAFKGGLGARITATWQSGTYVRGLAATADGAAGNLRFSDYGRMDLELFANLADQFGGASAPGWLKGARIGFNVDNLFNSRPAVRDDNGSTPFNVQPSFLEPLGRSLKFSLRKIF